VDYSLPLTYLSVELFRDTNILSIYTFYINQILIRSIQRNILNDKEILDRRTGKYIKPHSATLTRSRSSPDYMVKTVFNNLGNYVKSLIHHLCENQFNKTNDIINKTDIKKQYNS